MRKLLTILCSILIWSCGPSQEAYDALVSENKILETEISNLKTIIENYENSPERLYSLVADLVKNKNIEELTVICGKLAKYHPTSTEYKQTKTFLNQLIKEKEAKEKAEEAKRMQAVNKLRKKYDDISGITWYYNPHFTHYNNTNLMSLYIGKKGNDVWLRLEMSYEGDDWIFFDNAYLSYDENTMAVDFNEYQEKKTEVGNRGRVWEWIDVNVNDELLSFLNKMSKGKTLKMRLSGKYTHTRTLTYDEKKGIQDVLLAYDVLKN